MHYRNRKNSEFENYENLSSDLKDLWNMRFMIVFIMAHLIP